MVAVCGVSGCGAAASDLFVAPAVGACADVATPTSLRVVTWNIRAGLSSSIDVIGDVLEAFDADVIALQEVDRNADRSGGIDQAGELAERLSMQSTFAAARSEGDGDFGVALLSRIPFENAARVALPGDNAFEPRVALDAHLCAGAPGEEFHLRAATVHADIYPWSGQQNADFLADDLSESVGEGVVVAGDLNQSPEDGGPAAFTGRGFTDASADAPTFNDRRIDYVFVDDTLAGAASHVEDTDASDHRPMVVDFRP